MIQINPREIAAEALMEIMTADAYNTMTLRRLLRQNGAMSRQDRAFVTEVVNGTLRNLIYIDHVLNTFSKTKTEKMKPWLLAVLRTAVYQMYFMDVPDAAACNEAVKLASVRGYGSLKGFVNGVLRTTAKKKQEIPLPEMGTAEYLSVAYSHPLWLVRMWIAYYGYEETEQICAYDNQSPDVTIRVNTLKTNTQALKKKLEQAGVHVAEGRICADALHLTKTADLSRLDAFKEGLFHVQDISSQLCCLTLRPVVNETVLDVCAAPGGKSFTLAELMGNNGKLYSMDLHDMRVGLIEDGAARLGIKIITAMQNDASKFNGALPQADRVLCDVPCSGFGVIRRKPEIKYKPPEEFAGLPEIQYQILETSARYVKSGGTLVYSTCTLSRAENDDVADRFAASHPEFMPIVQPVPLSAPGDYKRTYCPDENGGDGFFTASFRRK